MLATHSHQDRATLGYKGVMKRIAEKTFIIILSEYSVAVGSFCLILKRDARPGEPHCVSVCKEGLAENCLFAFYRVLYVRRDIFAAPFYLVAQGLKGVITVIPRPLRRNVKRGGMAFLYLDSRAASPGCETHYP